MRYSGSSGGGGVSGGIPSTERTPVSTVNGKVGMTKGSVPIGTVVLESGCDIVGPKAVRAAQDIPQQ